MSNAAQPQATTTTTAATRPALEPAGHDSNGAAELLVMLPFVLAAVALAVRAAVFRRDSILGPPRLADDESPGIFLLGFAGGFVLWIVSQALVLPAATPTAVAPAPTTAPSLTTAPAAPEPSLPPNRMALVATLPAVIAAAFVIGLNVSVRRNALRRLGLSISQLRRGLVSGLIGSAIMIPLVFVVAVLTQLLWQAVHYQHPKEHDLLRLMGESQSPAVTILLIVSAVVVAPVWEEILFRGQLQTLITYALARVFDQSQHSGFDVISPMTAETLPPSTAPPRSEPAVWMRWTAIAFTSLAFAIVHPAWTIPPIFFLSLCLGYAYERTGNLWTVMFMHAAFNTTSTLIYLLFTH